MVSFHIPPSNPEQLERYAERSLRDLYQDEPILYFDVVHATVGDNPRKVKRLCRGLELAFEMMQLSLQSVAPSGDALAEAEPAGADSEAQPAELAEPRIAPANGSKELDSPKSGLV